MSDPDVYSTISLTNLPTGGLAGVHEIIISFIGTTIQVKEIEATICCAVGKARTCANSVHNTTVDKVILSFAH